MGFLGYSFKRLMEEVAEQQADGKQQNKFAVFGPPEAEALDNVHCIVFNTNLRDEQGTLDPLFLVMKRNRMSDCQPFCCTTVLEKSLLEKTYSAPSTENNVSPPCMTEENIPEAADFPRLFFLARKYNLVITDKPHLLSRVNMKDRTGKEDVKANLLWAAIDESFNLCKWNTHLAVMQYYGDAKDMQGCPQWLLPLSLDDQFAPYDKVDAVVVLAFEGDAKVGRYVTKTVLSVEMARGNARLCSMLDGTWLAPK